MAKKPNQLVAALTKVNLPRYICEHLFGHNHCHKKRISVGVVVMIIGVGVSKAFPAIAILHYTCDLLGYIIHGMVAVPVIEYLAEKETANDK
jgi:hypothetical protein